MTKLFLLFTLIISMLNPAAGQSVHTAGLKAILVVGHQEDGTARAVTEMDKIARLFTDHGVTVEKFYDRKAIWKEVVKASAGANFFVYSGHGTTLGGQNRSGGLCVEPTVSALTMQAELKLADQALVVFQSVCMGAGSSAGDESDIGPDEAEKRVGDYAYPFFSCGAAAYYATNYIGGALEFLSGFLNGDALGDGYKRSASGWTEIEFEKPYDRDPVKSISVASRPGGGTTTLITYTNGKRSSRQIPVVKGYNIAYVGEPGFSVKSMKAESTIKSLVRK